MNSEARTNLHFGIPPFRNIKVSACGILLKQPI